jgi:diguanylate cyclase (GGDEF)-like protein
MALRGLALALLPQAEFAPQAPDAFTVATMWLYVVTVLVVNFNLVGIAILRLFARIRDVADLDALTGVYNRRGLQARFAEQRARLLRRGTPFALVLLDLDHFKEFNDTHGHAAGDEALCTVTRVLSSLMRQEDAVGRFGGEEFVVLLADTDLRGAMVAAERLRAAIADEPVRLLAATHGVTASLGVAACRAVDDSLDELLQRADVAWEEPAPSAGPAHLPIVTHSHMK